MTCIAPPELTDLQLSMYLDDEADAGIHSHLIRCAHCQARARELALAQNAWRAALHRGSCPDSDQLRDYHFGFLSAQETRAVEQHLHLCPHCTHQLAALQEFVPVAARGENDVAEVVSPLQRIRWFLAELVQGGHGLTPALAGVRGGEDETAAAYEAGDVRIDIAVRGDPVLPEHRVLVGSVLGAPVDVDEEAEVWSADLWLDQQWVSTAAVDDLGSFRYVGLAPGSYELIINGPDVKVRVPVVVVE
jgi:hypothetical protein